MLDVMQIGWDQRIQEPFYEKQKREIKNCLK
jgi:hypothetical protein